MYSVCYISVVLFHLSVCLSFNVITRKLLIKSLCNVMEWLDIIQEPTD